MWMVPTATKLDEFNQKKRVDKKREAAQGQSFGAFQNPEVKI